jgi:hypothetical protein
VRRSIRERAIESWEGSGAENSRNWWAQKISFGRDHTAPGILC